MREAKSGGKKERPRASEKKKNGNIVVVRVLRVKNFLAFQCFNPRSRCQDPSNGVVSRTRNVDQVKVK